jgi:hypothetical protein
MDVTLFHALEGFHFKPYTGRASGCSLDLPHVNYAMVDCDDVAVAKNDDHDSDTDYDRRQA